MRIEQGPYVAVIHPERVPNKHEHFRVRYTIVKSALHQPLVVDGFAATWHEAQERVQSYLKRFSDKDQQDRDNGIIAI